MSNIKRQAFFELEKRLKTPLKTLQVLIGPRQVGKTTLIQQLRESLSIQSFYHTADSAIPLDALWIEQHWATARLYAIQTKEPVLLCFDEIQKIEKWSESVKKAFDEDRLHNFDIRVLLTGSSSLQLDTGLSDSLAGRFEKTIVTHWTYLECKEAYGITLDQFIRYGGYPGTYQFIEDPLRWVSYVQNALIDPVLGKDILMKHPVRKPILLKRLFELSCQYGGQIVSYQKFLGQLQDAGNVTTLAHYQTLLEDALLLKGLQKYTPSLVRQRSSSPKWIPLNTALMTAMIQDFSIQDLQNPTQWGRQLEVAIGAHLINQALGSNTSIYYWKQGIFEVDFVIERYQKLIAFEIKSGNDHQHHKGLAVFQKEYPHAAILKIGGDGIPLELFFSTTLDQLFNLAIPKPITPH